MKEVFKNVSILFVAVMSILAIQLHLQPYFMNGGLLVFITLSAWLVASYVAFYLSFVNSIKSIINYVRS